MLSTRRASRLSFLAPLAVGAALWTLTWVAGIEEFGWVGFLAAGIAWSALAGRSVPDLRDVRDLTDGRDPPAEPRTPGVSHLPPGRYVLDERTSRVRFRVRKLGLLPVDGTFTGAGGTLDVPEGSTAARVVAAVPAASFRTGNRRRDEHVVGPAFLDAAHHPVLRFTGEAALSAGDGGWAVPGVLTVRGSSRPATFAVESVQWLPAPGRVRLAARTTVRRSDFGIVAYRWLAADVIIVRVEAEASRS